MNVAFFIQFRKYRRWRVQTHTKTIPCWIDPNLCGPGTTWQMTWRNDFLNKIDLIESCSRERKNTKWRFYSLTNLTVFAALLKDVPMGWKDAVYSVEKSHSQISHLWRDMKTAK